MPCYLPINTAQFASTHETSPEIALAIFQIAEEDDEERMWREPTMEEMGAVINQAWQNADDDCTVLHWGNERINRSM